MEVGSSSSWSSLERECFFFLKSKTHRMATLLQIHAFILRQALDTNLNLVTVLITNLSSSHQHRGTCHARKVFDHMPKRPDLHLCSTMMKSHLSSRQFSEAFYLYDSLRRERGIMPNDYTFTVLTNGCSKNLLTREGMQVHAHVMRYGFNSNIYVANALVDMYGKTGKTDFARKVFDEMTERSYRSCVALMHSYIRGGNMVTAEEIFSMMPEYEKDVAVCTMMIDGYLKLGEVRLAEMLFHTIPDKDMMLWKTMIYAYANSGKMNSAEMLLYAAPEQDVELWNTLIAGYVKLGDMRSAKFLFDAMLEKNVISWTTMINGYVELGQMKLAKMVFDAMPKKVAECWNILIGGYVKSGDIMLAKMLFDAMPEKNVASWNIMINAFVKLGDMRSANLLFNAMPRKDVVSWTTIINGYAMSGEMRSAKMLLDFMPEKNVASWNTMINGFVKLKDMRSAKMLFDFMPEKNVISWTTMIAGYVQLGDMRSAKMLFDVMPEKNVGASTTMINGYVKQREMRLAKMVFDAMLEKNVTSCNILIGGYVKLGDLQSARMLFDAMPEKDLVSWTIMIDIYVKSGEMKIAKHLFDAMPEKDVVSWNTLLKGYVKLGDIKSAKMLFETMPEKNVVSWNTLILGYVKLGDMQSANTLFDAMPEKDVFSWNTLIDGYAKVREMRSAKEMFDAMPDKDLVSWNTLIDGYANVRDMRSAKEIFDAMPEKDVVSWTTMIHGYNSIGDIDRARWFFDKMPGRNLHSYSTMIGAYCKRKQSYETLLLFQQFLQWNVSEPDEVMILSVLPAIADLGALNWGNRVYDFVKKKKLDMNANVSTAVVDMYARCGEIEKARRVFQEVQARDAYTWTALINGLALNGCDKVALEVFAEMQKNRFKPNTSTLGGVLSACSHDGLVEEGIRWFNKIRELGIDPGIEHYGIIVDLLGKVGFLEEAEMFSSIPYGYGVNERMLTSLFYACINAKDAARAEMVVQKVTDVLRFSDSYYIMLRDLYAAKKKWTDVEQVEKLIRSRVSEREVYYSRVEIDGQILQFVARDESHPISKVAHLVLDQLQMHMKMQDPHFLSTMQIVELGIVGTLKKQDAMNESEEKNVFC